jgi:hypothetical protein
MTIPLIFFICLGIAVFGIIILFLNMLTAMSNFRSDQFHSIILVHIIAGLFYILGGLGTIGFGIAWIVTYLKH